MKFTVEQRFEAFSRVIASSNSSGEFFENLVHDQTLGQFIHGAAIYEFDHRQSLFLMGSYGKGVQQLENKVELKPREQIVKLRLVEP